MLGITFRTTEELEAALDNLRQSPKDASVLEMIVLRPSDDQRKCVEQAELDVANGMIGDNWQTRGSRKTPDGSAHPDLQITVMNTRAIDLFAQDKALWQWAGDNLLVDFDLSYENVPAGTQLAVGSAIIEVTDQPHTGCKKFALRFGAPATKFVNSTAGKQLNLRGINAKIVQAGTIAVGDTVRKL